MPSPPSNLLGCQPEAHQSEGALGVSPPVGSAPRHDRPAKPAVTYMSPAWPHLPVAPLHLTATLLAPSPHPQLSPTYPAAPAPSLRLTYGCLACRGNARGPFCLVRRTREPFPCVRAGHRPTRRCVLTGTRVRVLTCPRATIGTPNYKSASAVIRAACHYRLATRRRIQILGPGANRPSIFQDCR